MTHRTRLSMTIISGGVLAFLLCLFATNEVWAKDYTLRASAGNMTMPDGTVIQIWGFSDCGIDPGCTSNPPPTLPGPVLEVNEGETLNILVKNDLAEDISIVIAGQRIAAPANTTGVGTTYTGLVVPGNGGTGTYWVTSPKAGTYLYESGTSQAKQVQMGLYGALVVRPTGYNASTNRIAYSGAANAYDREQVLVLSDIDPAWHEAVQNNLPYSSVYFNPKYWLINGKVYPDTEEVLAQAGSKVLLRYLNAGSQDHVMVAQGIGQMGIADDGFPAAYPRETTAVVMNPGQTRDMILRPMSAGSFPLYDRRLDVTNRDHFPGGMISMVRVIGNISGLSFLSNAASFYVTQGRIWKYDVIAVDPGNLGGPLTYSLVNPPAGMTIDPVTGRVTWTAAGSSGVQSATVRVCSGPSTCINQSISVFVNHNPVINAIANQTVSGGLPYTYDVNATDPDPLDHITYSLLDVFAPLKIDPNTGVITGTLVEPQSGSHAYSIQVRASDGVGGVAVVSYQVTVNAVGPVAGPGGSGGGGTNTVTISPVEIGGGPITDFKFIVNLDNTPYVDPINHTCSIGQNVGPQFCPGRHQYESNSPVVADGTVTSSTPQNATISLPDGRYWVTVLPGICTPDPVTNACDPAMADLQMRNGGLYKLDGKGFSLPRDVGTSIMVGMHRDPLPLSQVTVQVFQDRRINGGWDMGLEGTPSRNGVVDRFSILLKDNLGAVSTDGLGNPLCSEYDAMGNVVPGTGGVCLTDANGFIRIKNLAPNKYAVFALPPEGSGWIQTTTIEGTKAIDAWVVEGNDGILPEGAALQAYLVFHGFVRKCAFKDTTDDCTTNDTPTGTLGTIHGQVKKLQPSRPPFIQPDGVGSVLKNPWVALNNLSGNGEYVALVRGDEQGNFIINDVPEGLYQAVIWDDAQDFIITMMTVSMPQVIIANGTATTNYNVELKDPRPQFNALLVPDWYSHLHGSVYLDMNENGVQETSEAGLPMEYVEVRHRDGSLLYSTLTDAEGKYEFTEFFPWMHWMVAGIGYTRLGGTGVHVIAGDELPKINQGVVEDRVDHGPVLTMGTMNWTGDSNRMDWGKKPYPLLGYRDSTGSLATDSAGNVINDYMAPNGGISGAVWYATTRNEEDVRFAAADDWEPGVPDLLLNLYERIVDPVTGQTMMGPDGAAIKGRWIGQAVTDHYNRAGAMPADCEYIDPTTGATAVDSDCDELIYVWNQVKTGIWDGAYQFFYDCSNPNYPNDPVNQPPLLDPEVVGVGPNGCRPVPAGTYLVEVELPEHYKVVTENDRNVLDQGDSFDFAPQRNLPKCVGPLYDVMDPGQPDYIAPPAAPRRVNSCIMKEVPIETFANAAADFHIFTEVPIPGHMRGFVNDNLNIEAAKTKGWYGDKAGVPFVPVSIRDFAGKEIARVYTDADGHFETLLPSTNRVNVPTPSGVAPNILRVYANDPGTAQNPDPHFNINYNTLIMEGAMFPGTMAMMDLALIPINGFLANQHIECGPNTAATLASDQTPEVTGVSQPYGDNTGSSSLTVEGIGFGTSGRVTLGGVDANVTSWSNTAIGITIPAGSAQGPMQMLVIRGDNGKISPSGMTIHVTGLQYNPAFVPVTTTIQAAIDVANPGDVVLVPAGIFRENPIVWKPVTLQGYGSGKSTIDGVYFDAVIQNLWQTKMNALITNGSVSTTGGQPLASIMATVTVAARQGAGGHVIIDGLTIQGSRIGGGIHVNSFANNTEISNNNIKNNFGSFTGGIGFGFPNFGNNQILAPRVHHNLIIHNGSVGPAGGVGIFDGANDYQIDHNLICANGTTTSGGGISQYGKNRGSNPGRIEHNDILFNWAFADGGGISIQGIPSIVPAAFSDGTGPVEISNNRLQGNYATLEGGGMSLRRVGSFTARLTNNIIVDNLSTAQGGGITVEDASNMSLVNNTLAKNNSTSTNIPLEVGIHPAGMVVHQNTTPFQATLPAGSSTISDVALLNNIFWQNIAYIWDGSALVVSGNYDLGVYHPGSPVENQLSHVRNNIFTTLPASVDPTAWNKVGVNPEFVSPLDLTLTGTYVPAAGEIAINPLAVPVTVYYSPLSPVGDYHVQETSPALEYGALVLLGSSPTVMAAIRDYDDQARPINDCIDTGADERSRPVGSPSVCSTSPPVAAISPISGAEGGATLLDGSGSTPLSSIISFTWTFGDGSPTQTLVVPTVSHVYQDQGTYPVTLNIVTSTGLTAGTSAQASISNVPPVVNAGPDRTANADQLYSFTGTASDPGSVDNAAPMLFVWDFGDGSSLVSGATASHAFTFEPLHTQFTVTLSVTDKDGGVGTDTLIVSKNEPPVISSTPALRAVAGFGYSYQVVATDPNGDATLSYALSGPASLSIHPTTGLVSGTPTTVEMGNHMVTITVTDALGASTMQTYTLEVVQDAIFSDSFESGSLSAWSSVIRPINTAVDQVGAVTIGTKGLIVNVSYNYTYLVDSTPIQEPSYHARFFFDPNGTTLGTSILTLFSGVNGAQDVFRLQLTGNSGNHQLRIQGRKDDGTYVTSAWLVGINDDVHTIEVSWDASGAGSLSLRLDERLALRTINLTGIPNSLQRVEEVRLGKVAATGAVSGRVYIDDFVSTRKSIIGPQLLQSRFGGGINTALWTEVDLSNVLTENQKLIWASSATNETRIGTLDGKFPIDGAFDIRVEFQLPTWSAPSAAGSQALKFVVSSMTGSGTPDTTNRLAISRKWVGPSGFNGYESEAIVGGSSTVSRNANGATTGFLRVLRTGATVSAHYWNAGTKTWVALGSATLPVGPVFLSVEGSISGGTAAIQMEMDTLKVTAGSVTIP